MKQRKLRYIKWACLFLILLGCEIGHAQFVIWGDIREKFQYRDGYGILKGPEDVGFLLNVQRTRFGMNYEKNDMGFVLSFEDTRTWGESSSLATSDGLGLSSAYFYIRFKERFIFDIGRRELKYEDGRFITDAGWSDKTASIDAFMFKYRSLNSKTKADIGFSLSNNSANTNFLTSYGVKNMYKYFVWAFASHEFGDKDLIWSTLYAQDINQKENNKDILYNRFTVGTYFTIFPKKQVNGYLYGYGQWGKDRKGQALNAYLVSAQLKYKVHPKFEMVLAYDFTSGTNYKKGYGSVGDDIVGVEGASTDFTSMTFDRFMGSGHSFFGYLDYFSLKGTADRSQGAGLHQPYLRLFYKPHKQHSIELTGRYFSLVEPYVVDRSLPEGDALRGVYQKMPRSLGTEIDLLYKYKIFEDLDVSVGYSVMLVDKNNTLERISGILPGQSKYSQFAYVVLTYKPTLFDSDYNAKKKTKEAPKGYRHKSAPNVSTMMEKDDRTL